MNSNVKLNKILKKGGKEILYKHPIGIALWRTNVCWWQVVQSIITANKVGVYLSKKQWK